MHVFFMVMFISEKEGNTQPNTISHNLSKMLQRFVKDNPSSNLWNSPPKFIVQWKTDPQEMSSSWVFIHVFGGWSLELTMQPTTYPCAICRWINLCQLLTQLAWATYNPRTSSPDYPSWNSLTLPSCMHGLTFASPCTKRPAISQQGGMWSSLMCREGFIAKRIAISIL